MKEFLSRRHIPFQEVHLFRQANAIDDLMRLTGSFTAPVAIVGKRFVRGYDPVLLSRLLEEEGWLSRDNNGS
ncbi:glutaredoxin family protein [Alicyclobacillus mengziensis]|uniref:Glutaredoxin family protein n=1 Tax=Alicyclobacillus mengziensis TaxID=2931921 RepID=A0A9X7VYD1_9BACL|nr:glutaredoxin family protein [Alicyclobacillus mengziensis]QSO46875.1 glutaredoxin family protein [Alicyclobacillus mengziensis]